jgi:hypothetical protein
MPPAGLTKVRESPTRPCPVDHVTGSRSQMRMEATSTVPATM